MSLPIRELVAEIRDAIQAVRAVGVVINLESIMGIDLAETRVRIRIPSQTKETSDG